MRRILGRFIEWLLSYEHIVYYDTNKPKTGYPGDAGYDLYVSEDTKLDAHQYKDIPVLTRFDIPRGIWLILIGRSSASRRMGLDVVTGVIDQGYRGQMFVQVRSDKSTVIKAGTRLAQVIPFRLIPLRFKCGKVEQNTVRSDKGFGSSGI